MPNRVLRGWSRASIKGQSRPIPEIPRPVPDNLKAILLVVASIVVTLGAVEGGVRLFVDNGMQYDLEMWKYARAMKRVSEIPEVGHEHRPGTHAHLMGVDVSINSTKQRNPEVPKTKPDNTYRILMLGDSLTFGWGVREAETAARRLEAALNSGGRAGPRISVINAGVGNYNFNDQVNVYGEYLFDNRNKIVESGSDADNRWGIGATFRF